jgi:hypothetical protein
VAESLPRSEDPDLLRLRDPLSEVTRKERRGLLGVSLLSATVALSGLLPTEIGALGVKLAAKDQRTLLLVLAAVCLYYLVAFVIYAASDLAGWQKAIRESISERMVRSYSEPDQYDIHVWGEVQDKMAERYPWLVRADRLVRPVSVARALFEFALPICVGVVAVAILAVKSAA